MMFRQGNQQKAAAAGVLIGVSKRITKIADISGPMSVQTFSAMKQFLDVTTVSQRNIGIHVVDSRSKVRDYYMEFITGLIGTQIKTFDAFTGKTPHNVSRSKYCTDQTPANERTLRCIH